jgi:putative spermidine/putrescine transport system permease protein
MAAAEFALASPTAAPRATRSLWLIVPAAAVISVFLLLPYLNIVVMSLRPRATGAPHGAGFTLDNYARIITDEYYLGVLTQSLTIGVMTTVICLLIGYPVAYHLARSTSKWKGLLYVLVLSPLLVGVVVRTFGWLIILSRGGVINRALQDAGLIDAPLTLMNNMFGVTLALVHVFLPFMILPLVGALQAVDPSLETAARSLGASRFTAFRKIVLPLSWPGIKSGTVLVFVLALSAYVTPNMLGGAQVRTWSVLVVQALVDNFQWPHGAALALILAACGALAAAAYVKAGSFLARGVR